MSLLVRSAVSVAVAQVIPSASKISQSATGEALLGLLPKQRESREGDEQMDEYERALVALLRGPDISDYVPGCPDYATNCDIIDKLREGVRAGGEICL